MTDPKRPAPGQEPSLTELAASLARDKDASLVGELDLGLDGDPDLMTRPGMQSLRRPPRRSFARTAGRLIVVILLLATVGWMFGLLNRFGLPPPPEAVTTFLGGESTDAVPAKAPPETKRKGKRRR